MKQIDPFDVFWEQSMTLFGRRLFAAQLLDGPAGVVRLLLDGPDPITLEMPTADERQRRQQVVGRALDEIAQEHGWA